MTIKRDTIMWPSGEGDLSIAFIVKGAAGWVDLIVFANNLTHRDWSSWSICYNRSDGALMGSTFLGATAALDVLVKEGSDALFKLLEERYAEFNWEDEPISAPGYMKMPGPLPEEVKING
jgi:hypothetical protein